MFIGQSIETLFRNIPLSILEVWGSFGFLIGFIIALFAYSGFIFHTGLNWGLGREWRAWDGRAFMSMGLTFVLICLTGYIGSFYVLVPGAQTFESLKDLTVFVCIVLFGYPALLVVPIAYGLSDFYEGIPIDFIMDWWMGYLINPACFWLALQLIGKCPDFRKRRTWGLYGVFVIAFMSIEPILWGFVCSGKFSIEDSYYVITPALFFTTLVTWIFAPFFMLLAYPLARKTGYFWADIPGHVKQKRWREADWAWESGDKDQGDEECRTDSDAGVPIRFFILAPFIAITLFIMGATSYFTLKSFEKAAHRHADVFHEAIMEKTKLRLLESTGRNLPLDQVLSDEVASAFIINRSGKILSSSIRNFSDEVATSAIAVLKDKLRKNDLNLKYKVNIKLPRQLTGETWLIQAVPTSRSKESFLVTAVPENFYLSGIRKSQGQSALVFAAGLVLVLMVVSVLGAMVISPIRRTCHAAHALSQGELSQRVPESRLAEMNTLSIAFNSMAEKLQESFHRIAENENRIKLAVESGELGVWEWDIPTGKVYWNDIMFRQHGLQPGTAVTFTEWTKLIVPEDIQRVTTEIEAALQGEKKYNVEFKVRRKDGSVHVLQAHSNTLRDEKGGPVKMIGISYDVTESRNAEKELKLYRSQLEEVVRRRTDELTRKTHQLARAEVYEKVAQIFLSMRDYTNSPLQAQYFSIGLLKKRCPEQKDIIETLELSVQKLSSINRILSRLESDFPTEKLLSEKEILEYLDKVEHRS